MSRGLSSLGLSGSESALSGSADLPRALLSFHDRGVRGLVQKGLGRGPSKAEGEALVAVEERRGLVLRQEKRPPKGLDRGSSRRLRPRSDMLRRMARGEAAGLSKRPRRVGGGE